jgi:hypothetical protein
LWLAFAMSQVSCPVGVSKGPRRARPVPQKHPPIALVAGYRHGTAPKPASDARTGAGHESKGHGRAR